jgi:hypothetical protein
MSAMRESSVSGVAELIFCSQGEIIKASVLKIVT